MQRTPRDQARKYAFDCRDEPLLRVRCGESFEVETWDASTGYFKTPADKADPKLRPGFDRSPPQANPTARRARALTVKASGAATSTAATWRRAIAFAYRFFIQGRCFISATCMRAKATPSSPALPPRPAPPFASISS